MVLGDGLLSGFAVTGENIIERVSTEFFGGLVINSAEMTQIKGDTLIGYTFFTEPAFEGRQQLAGNVLQAKTFLPPESGQPQDAS